jgi:hypothetical protein
MEFIVKNIYTIVSIVAVIISIVAYVIEMLKAIKEKRYQDIAGLTIGFIEDAEKLTSKNGDAVSGEVKKKVVLANIQTICSAKNFKYDENLWSSMIDTYVGLTLRVNQRQQDVAKVKAIEAPKTIVNK